VLPRTLLKCEGMGHPEKIRYTDANRKLTDVRGSIKILDRRENEEPDARRTDV